MKKGVNRLPFFMQSHTIIFDMLSRIKTSIFVYKTLFRRLLEDLIIIIIHQTFDHKFLYLGHNKTHVIQLDEKIIDGYPISTICLFAFIDSFIPR